MTKPSKLQAPSTKLQRNTKLQTAYCSKCIWSLKIGASLVLGAWRLVLLSSPARDLSEFVLRHSSFIIPPLLGEKSLQQGAAFGLAHAGSDLRAMIEDRELQ